MKNNIHLPLKLYSKMTIHEKINVRAYAFILTEGYYNKSANKEIVRYIEKGIFLFKSIYSRPVKLNTPFIDKY